MISYDIKVDWSLIVNVPQFDYNNLINIPPYVPVMYGAMGSNGVNGINGIDGLNGKDGKDG